MVPSGPMPRPLLRLASPAALLGTLLGILVATPAAAQAQPVARPPEGRGGPRTQAALGRFGVGAAVRGLESDAPDARRRSVERLGSLGSEEAVAALVDALEPGLLRADARVAALRAIAPHVARDEVRAALVRELLQAGASRREAARGTGETTRGVAALALARSGNDRALAALGAAVAQGGPAGAAARDALIAFPPQRLEPILGRVGPRASSRIDGRVVAPPLLSLLGELGDARALPILRAALGAAAPGTRAEAARALSRLGDEAALSFANASARGDAAARVVAAEVRARLGEAGAPAAIEALLRDVATRPEGVRLARMTPDPRLAAALLAACGDARPEIASEAIAALGETGRGVPELLARATAADPLAVPAAVALGRAPGSAARDALAGALSRGAGAPGGARVVLAGAVRALALGDAPPGLEDALRNLARGSEAGGAELGIFGLVALGAISVDDAIDARPTAVAEGRWWGAIARGALAAGPDARRALGSRWRAREGGGGPDLAAAAAVALLDPASAAATRTTELVALTLDGGPGTALAARELARRDDGSLRAHVDRLGGGVDPRVRAHVALGLGGSADPAAASRLVDLALGDDDAGVRAAAVRGLSRRVEPQRRRALSLASELDPDAAVRALARAALAGRAIGDPIPEGGDVAVALVEVAGDTSALAPAWTARVGRPDGLTIPVVVPTGGWLVLSGVGAGEGALLLVEPSPAVHTGLGHTGGR